MLEQGGSFAGVNRKVQLKPLRWAAPEEGSTEQPHVVEALLILKHGGVLTHAGRQQVCSHYNFAVFRGLQQLFSVGSQTVFGASLHTRMPADMCVDSILPL